MMAPQAAEAKAPVPPSAEPPRTVAQSPALPPPAVTAPVAVPAAPPSQSDVAPAAPPPPLVGAPAPLPPASSPVAAAPAPPTERHPAPQFDIVRVNPQGQAVIAGRGVPGSEVILRASGEEIGRVVVDGQGQWVLVGGRPLPPGSHEITLSMRLQGGAEIPAEGAVLVAVAHSPAPPAPAAVAKAPDAAPVSPTPPPAVPIVVMTTPQGAPQLLQAPGRAGASQKLGLDLVDYDDDGEIRFAGTAPPGTVVRAYVNDQHVGDVTAGADGRWSIIPGSRVAQGDHRLRLDQVDASGRVAARVELPFQRAVVAQADPAGVRVVVQPKQSLWRIARRAYGKGVRYTEIFAANRDQISDPNRIYPGQVFSVPGAAAPQASSTPTTASRSR
jgi:nucleoid-associated protein YgaU